MFPLQGLRGLRPLAGEWGQRPHSSLLSSIFSSLSLQYSCLSRKVVTGLNGFGVFGDKVLVVP